MCDVCVWGGVCVRERVTRRRERLKSVLLDRLAWHNWGASLSRRPRRPPPPPSPQPGRIAAYTRLSNATPLLLAPRYYVTRQSGSRLRRELARLPESACSRSPKLTAALRSTPPPPPFSRPHLPPRYRQPVPEDPCVFTNPVSFRFLYFSTCPSFTRALA